MTSGWHFSFATVKIIRNDLTPEKTVQPNIGEYNGERKRGKLLVQRMLSKREIKTTKAFKVKRSGIKRPIF